MAWQPTVAVASLVAAMVAAAGVLVALAWQRQAARGPMVTRWVMLALLNSSVLVLCVAAVAGLWAATTWMAEGRVVAARHRWAQGLHDPDAEQRLRACERVGAAGLIEARDDLLALLDDPDLLVQEAATDALGDLGADIGPAAIRTLARRLLTDQLGRAQHTSDALEKIGAAAVAPLSRDLQAGTLDQQVAAVAGLVAAGPPGRAAIATALNADAPALRRAVLLGVGWHALERSGTWQGALGALGDPDRHVRWTAIWAFVRLRPRTLDEATTARHLKWVDTALGETVGAWLPAAAGADGWDRRVARELAAFAGGRPWAIRTPLDAALADPVQAPSLIPALRWLAPAEEMAVPRLLQALWRPALRDAAIAALRDLGTPAVAARCRSIARTARVPAEVREACLLVLAGLPVPADPTPADPPAPAGGSDG